MRILRGRLLHISVLVVSVLATVAQSSCNDGGPLEGTYCDTSSPIRYHCHSNDEVDPFFFLERDNDEPNGVDEREEPLWFFYYCSAAGRWRRVFTCDALCPQPNDEAVIRSCVR